MHSTTVVLVNTIKGAKASTIGELLKWLYIKWLIFILEVFLKIMCTCNTGWNILNVSNNTAGKKIKSVPYSLL